MKDYVGAATFFFSFLIAENVENKRPVPFFENAIRPNNTPAQQFEYSISRHPSHRETVFFRLIATLWTVRVPTFQSATKRT